MAKTEELLKTNIEVREVWTMTCPHCGEESSAPFNDKNPGSPMQIDCEECFEKFILTYERD